MRGIAARWRMNAVILRPPSARRILPKFSEGIPLRKAQDHMKRNSANYEIAGTNQL
jgi:hypothetical protein